MIRLLFLLHRYLGIAVGALMAMWCLSGLVMMYVSYPALDGRTRLAHLTPINWGHCCRISGSILGDTDPVPPFRVEMLGGRPVLNLQLRPESAALIDLSTGARIDQVSATQAASVAAAYTPVPSRAGAARIPGASGITRRAPRLIDQLDFDQWTLEGISPAQRPLYHFDLHDSRGGELYVSSSTGRAVQLTTRWQRFWNWLGAVPHWLYFADLRHHVWLWSQVVIYTSLIGCFLAATGLYIGVRQLICSPRERWSPYRGFNLWHHISGLLFGLFALTWVLSGLLSMNPWGLMEGGGAGAERAQLRGAPISGMELRAALQNLAAAAPADAVSIESASLAGKLFVIASRADGRRRRLDAYGAATRLSSADRRFIAASLHGEAEGMQLLRQGDAYYFSFPGDPVELPVWRVLTRDGTGRRYYVDPVSGTLIAAVDRGSEHYRWWHDALHRMDFAALVRGRPQWDVLMWLLMSGATVICVTGTYLGYRRLAQ
ncbi:MAG TPA: hypothetical protein VMU40_18785 [Steroidobacteraceae bacterium]|nr:hypothetical protein [Steroidobacteraceae bacterium]